jgi:hypothetical protein
VESDPVKSEGSETEHTRVPQFELVANQQEKLKKLGDYWIVTPDTTRNAAIRTESLVIEYTLVVLTGGTTNDSAEIW